MNSIKSSDLKNAWMSEDDRPQLILHYNLPRAVIIPLTLERFPTEKEVYQQIVERAGEWLNQLAKKGRK